MDSHIAVGHPLVVMHMTQYDPIDTQVQEAARNQSDARKQQAHIIEQEDLRWLMEHKRGRRILWRWLERAGLWRVSFNTEALVMAFNEGGRNQGLHLMHLLLASSPKLYNLMVEEAHDDRDERHIA